MKEQDKKKLCKTKQVIMHGKTLFIAVLMVILIASIAGTSSSPNTIKPMDNILNLSHSQQEETEEQKIGNTNLLKITPL